MYKKAILLVSLPLLLAAAEKPAPEAKGANAGVALSATLYNGKDAVREQLGSDLDGYFILVKVELTPKGDKPLVVSRDDFVLRSYKDGQWCQPYAPSQIAGRAELVVSPTGRGGVAAEQGGPVFGAPGGIGMPGRLPGSTGTLGTPTTDDGSVQAKTETAAKEDPVLAVLKAKILPEKKTSTPVSGLLYFMLEGKHKPKDLVLQYKTPAGRIDLKFR
jgi:hypothetical protein